jgi:uncharacterized protein
MRALELIGMGVWCLVVATVGGALGLVLGNIRLPLVLSLASSPAAGAGANIGISAVSAAAGSVAHIRAGRVNWRLAAWMAPPSVAGAIAGGYVSGRIPGRLLLVLIGALLVYFGARILRPKQAPGQRPADGRLDIRQAVIAGLWVGVLGGMIGLILGTLRLPAMIRRVGETTERAVGTNLVVGLCVGIAGVVGHVPAGVDWQLLGIGGLASIPGAVIGSRLTGRLSEQRLMRAIGIVLLITGALTLARAVTS